MIKLGFGAMRDRGISQDLKPQSRRMAKRKDSCVVLGGGGFLGINLCRRLASAGFRVRAFGRSCQFPDDLDGVEWHQGDFCDPDALSAAIESFDIVFHLIHAMMPEPANLNMPEDLQKSVVPSVALLEMCRKLDTGRTIFISSGGTVYGRPHEIPTPETAPAEPTTGYGMSKLIVEKYLALHEYLYGLDYRVLRVTNAFGPFQTPLKRQGVIATLISHALNNERIEIWGDGTAVRDFVFVDDVIDALLAAAKDESGARIFNIGSGRGRSLHEIIAAIERLLGKKLDISFVAGRPIDIPVSIVAVDRAREILGWKPKTSLEMGLQKTIQWWQERLLFAAP